MCGAKMPFPFSPSVMWVWGTGWVRGRFVYVTYANVHESRAANVHSILAHGLCFWQESCIDYSHWQKSFYTNIGAYSSAWLHEALTTCESNSNNTTCEFNSNKLLHSLQHCVSMLLYHTSQSSCSIHSHCVSHTILSWLCVHALCSSKLTQNWF